MEASHDVSQQGAGSSCRAVNEVRAFQGPGRSRKRASALPCSSAGNPCSSMLRCCTVTSPPKPCLHAKGYLRVAFVLRAGTPVLQVLLALDFDILELQGLLYAVLLRTLAHQCCQAAPTNLTRGRDGVLT